MYRIYKHVQCSVVRNLLLKLFELDSRIGKVPGLGDYFRCVGDHDEAWENYSPQVNGPVTWALNNNCCGILVTAELLTLFQRRCCGLESDSCCYAWRLVPALFTENMFLAMARSASGGLVRRPRGLRILMRIWRKEYRQDVVREDLNAGVKVLDCNTEARFTYKRGPLGDICLAFFGLQVEIYWTIAEILIQCHVFL